MSDEEDSMELDRMCFRCSGDDASLKLLVCSVIGCPIAVHLECMVSEPEIDEKGRFYCPYCAHKRAVVMMEKLRRKALRAKEVLSMFIMSREVRDEVAVRNVGEIEGIGIERGETENEAMEMDEDVSKGNAEQQYVLSDKRNVDNAMEEVPAVDNAVVPESDDFQGGSPLLRKKRYKKRAQRVQVQRVIPMRMVSSPSKKASSCQTEAVEEDAEKRNEKDTSFSSSRKVSEVDQNDKGAASFKSSGVPAEMNQNEKVATLYEFRKSPELNRNEKLPTFSFDLNEVPESDWNEKAANNLSSESREIPKPSQNVEATEVLPRSRKVPDLNQNEKTTSSTEPIKVPESGSEELLFHYGGRRRVNWTAEELKTLKEGVLFFTTQVNKNLPWRKILDSGSHVFHKTRTPSNLKDKWQVLCREASNKKQT